MWKKKNNNNSNNVTWARYEYITNSRRIYLRLAFLLKGRKATELINKGKGKEERNKLYCKGKESGCSKLNLFQRLL